MLGIDRAKRRVKSGPSSSFHHTDTHSTSNRQLTIIAMAWRNQGITGSNNIPLGARRRFGGSDSAPPPDDGGYNPSQPQAGLSDGNYKRGRSPERSNTALSRQNLD